MLNKSVAFLLVLVCVQLMIQGSDQMPVPASVENLIEALNRRHGHKENNHHHGGYDYEQHHGHHHGHHKRSTTTASPEEITTQAP
uniref:Secreted protein n=1 Tax=Daphnia galeata TaxID=27404 RepID=A0A8J2RS35_9CRUS|nr:unnamed protein product [Daphnia galeata]